MLHPIVLAFDSAVYNNPKRRHHSGAVVLYTVGLGTDRLCQLLFLLLLPAPFIFRFIVLDILCPFDVNCVPMPLHRSHSGGAYM